MERREPYGACYESSNEGVVDLALGIEKVCRYNAVNLVVKSKHFQRSAPAPEDPKYPGSAAATRAACAFKL